ncbi:MAG: hypothetical protein RR425_06490 [Erysipelotrichales bacterium]
MEQINSEKKAQMLLESLEANLTGKLGFQSISVDNDPLGLFYSIVFDNFNIDAIVSHDQPSLFCQALMVFENTNEYSEDKFVSFYKRAFLSALDRTTKENLVPSGHMSYKVVQVKNTDTLGYEFKYSHTNQKINHHNIEDFENFHKVSYLNEKILNFCRTMYMYSQEIGKNIEYERNPLF